MKRRPRNGSSIAKPLRKKKKEQKGVSWIFIFSLVILFSVSLVASYVYFKPLFVFESAFIEEIGAGHSGSDREERKAPGPLYRSHNEQSMGWYNAKHRQDSSIVHVEGLIRQYLESYQTSLLDLYMDKEGVIYIDIGKEIRTNFRGSAYEEYNMIAGLCKSIKKSIPEFTALKIMIEGKEAESFGGHIDISRTIRGDISGVSGAL